MARIENRDLPDTVPFFARYLEGQDCNDLSDEQMQAVGGGRFITRKYPSDQEGVSTRKFPSDSDVVTRKFPSDGEGGSGYVTLKYPSDNETVFGSLRIFR